MMALNFAKRPSYEVVVVGHPGKDDTKKLLTALNRTFIPTKVVLFRPSQVEHPEIARIAEFTRDLSIKDGKATAYVCHNYQCNLPTTSKEEMLRLLDETT